MNFIWIIGRFRWIPEALLWSRTSKSDSPGGVQFKKGWKMNRSSAWRIGIALLFLGARASAGARQQQPTSAVSQTASNAATAYDGKDWAKSAKLYAQIVQAAPNPRAWYRLGVSLNKIGENDKAIEAFEKGRALGLPPQFAEYGIAVVFVSKKDQG